MNNLKINSALIAMLMVTFFSCKKKDSTPAPEGISIESNLVIAVATEGEDAPDVLLGASKDGFIASEVDPTGNGIQQLGRRYFTQIGTTLLSSGYKEQSCAGYKVSDNRLIEKGRYTFDLSQDLIVKGGDDNTAITVGAPRAGLADRIFQIIDLDEMKSIKTMEHRIDEDIADTLAAWPTGGVVKGNKFYLSYYLVKANGTWSTPKSNEAKIAVYSYPGLEFEKYIVDDRAANIGIYGNFNGLVEADNGDIYSFSSSSLACGFSPVPTNKSAILRIKKSDTDFDENYHFDFETISKGNKINFFHYAGGTKAIVRMVMDDSGLWSTFGPTTETPMCKIAVVDLEAKTVTEVTEIPLHGGQWGTPALNYDDKVYINISDSKGAYIYEIDPSTATAKKGKKVVGTEIKGMFAL